MLQQWLLTGVSHLVSYSSNVLVAMIAVASYSLHIHS